MKVMASRLALAAATALAVWVVLIGATVPRASQLEPNKLVILSTVDVKAKSSPCG
jgi:hypothetical protein